MQPDLIDARRPPALLAAFVALLVAMATPAIVHAQAAPSLPVSPGAASASLPDIAAIAARFAPVVVNISVTGTRKVSTASDPAPDPAEDPDSAPAPDESDAMRDFLRNFQQRFGGLPPQLKLPVRGEGPVSSCAPMD